MLVVSKLSDRLNRVQVAFRQTTGFHRVQISDDRRRLEFGKLVHSKNKDRAEGGETRKDPSPCVDSCRTNRRRRKR